MNNLPAYIALEKLTSTVTHGRVLLEYQVRNGEIVGIIATGKKKLPFNSTTKDTHTNTAALEVIIKRIKEQLESKRSSEIVFKVVNHIDKIKSVEIESKQTLPINHES